MGLATAASGGDDDTLPRVLLNYGGVLLLGSFLAAAALASLFVLALRLSPWALVMLACTLQVGAPLAAAAVASNAGNSPLALILLLAAAAIALLLFASRAALNLVARLLGLAAAALRDCPVLLPLGAVLQLTMAGAAAVAALAAAAVAAAGDVVPNPLRYGNPRCTAPSGEPVTCCAWQPSPVLLPYAPLAAAALIWTLMLLLEIKVFVVSGVVSQWYFSPAGHVGRAAGSGGGGRRGAASAYSSTVSYYPAILAPTAAGGAEALPLLYGGDGAAGGAAAAGAGAAGGVAGARGFSSLRAAAASLGHALGPSFGSLAAAGGVLGATAQLRAVVNRLTSRAHRAAALQQLAASASASAAGLGAGAGGAASLAAAAACCAPCCCCCCLPAFLGCCCAGLAALLQQLTAFATVQMALSGAAFLPASHAAVALLSRNAIDAYNMWWYLPTMLHSAAAAFAAAWGYGAFLLASASAPSLWPPLAPAAAQPLPPAAAAALGLLAAATAALALGFVCGLLVNIAEALFYCYALDRDNAAVTWYELHAVCGTLPCCADAQHGQYDHHQHGGGSLHGGGGGGAAAAYVYVPAPQSPVRQGYGIGSAPHGYGSYQPPPVAPPPYHTHAHAHAHSHAHMHAHHHPVRQHSQQQLGYPVVYDHRAPQRQPPQPAYGGGSYGFWGWLRSPGGGAQGAASYRNDRPQYQPPAVLSPPYSDASSMGANPLRWPFRPPAGPQRGQPPAPPPPYYAGQVP